MRTFQDAGGVSLVGAMGATVPPPAPATAGGHSSEYRMMVVVLASVLGSLLFVIAIGTFIAVRQWRRVSRPFISVRPPSHSAPFSHVSPPSPWIHAVLGTFLPPAGSPCCVRVTELHILCSSDLVDC